jgi:hypothetical protein
MIETTKYKLVVGWYFLAIPVLKIARGKICVMIGLSSQHFNIPAINLNLLD